MKTAFALISVASWSLLAPGAMRPAAHVVDANDHTLDLKVTSGRPTIVLYEDKDSSKVNAAFKAELSALARGGRYRTVVALVPVADVQSYDFWPARGFVKDAIRDESAKIGTPIYCDWNGAFQRALGFRRGTSSVMLIGRDGRIRFAVEGQLTPEQRAEVLREVREEVEEREGS